MYSEFRSVVSQTSVLVPWVFRLHVTISQGVGVTTNPNTSLASNINSGVSNGISTYNSSRGLF